MEKSKEKRHCITAWVRNEKKKKMKIFDKLKIIKIIINILKIIKMKNWKTLLGAVVTALPTVLGFFGVPFSPELGHAIEVIGGVIIGFFAKDSNVTGGTTPQTLEAKTRVA